MLTELIHPRQIHGEPTRRWFTSPAMDLIVWHDANAKPTGFQLCYDKGSSEKAITWHEGGQLVHTAINDGESMGINMSIDTRIRYKESPILVADGAPDYAYITGYFLSQSAKLPAEISELVIRALSAHT